MNSGRVVVVDAQTFLIPRFSYDGQAPDAHFWVGQGKPGPEGNFVADENGSSEPLRSYREKTLVIVLPGDLTVFDIGESKVLNMSQPLIKHIKHKLFEFLCQISPITLFL